MSCKRNDLEQIIEEKLIENILTELDEEDFIVSNDKQEESSEIFMLGLLALNEVRYLEPPGKTPDHIFTKYCIVFSKITALVLVYNREKKIRSTLPRNSWMSGNVHDAKVYRNSHFYLNRSSLIKGNEFLIGDSAYPLSPFLIKPFKLHDDMWMNRENNDNSEDDDESDNYNNDNEESLKRAGEAKIMSKLFTTL
ncbi:putative nuclease HARBI1 [Rhizophagus clarus]|uniref:Putative nuclease HARBI1 n=1 Tax=Rhizophagus clarus TaxID=94130 RepID=A0A8H3LG15_9GLOM|nr:putative nuclease HARBI1 [Rhizophagus clarus]